MTVRPLIFAALAALLAAGDLPAQGELKIPPRNRDRGRLVLPAPAKEKEPKPVVKQEVPSVTTNRFFLNPANRYEEVFSRFEQLTRIGDEEYRAALSELEGMGLGTRNTAVKALGSQHFQSVELAARLLESVGEPEDAQRLIEVASGVGVSDVVATCLETGLRLNGGWLPARAVRLLEHPRKSVRAASESRLDRMPHSEHLRPLLQLARFGRDADCRLRAVRLLGNLRSEDDARDALRAVLVDPAVPVALAAAQALAGTGGDAEIAYLREQILELPPGPEMAYLTWALLGMQQRMERILIDEEMEQKFLAVLDEPNIFLTGVAAACLAEFGFRSQRDEGFEYLDREVPHSLVRAVAGVTYFPQYANLLPLAEASLTRITGEDFGEENPGVWLEWLVENLDGFRAVRGVLKVGSGDHARLQVGWRIGDDPWRWMGGPESPVSLPEARLLGKRDLAQLVGALEEARVLDLPLHPGAYGEDEDPILAELEVQVGNRRKRVAYRGESLRPWMADLNAGLNGLYEQTGWQLLAPMAERRDFVLPILPRWDGSTPENRLATMVELTHGRLKRMDDQSLAIWSKTLVAQPGVEEFWDEDLAMGFIDEITVRGVLPEVGMPVLQAALLKPGPELTAPFLEAVLTVPEPSRSDLLLAGFERLGFDVCSASLSDPRLTVRVGAARAMHYFGSEAVPALSQALVDENQLVVRAAARSLGRIADPAAMPALVQKVDRAHPKDVRKEALWALGEIGHGGALDAIFGCALDEDPGVQISAIMALGRIPGPAVNRSFMDLWTRYAGTPLESPFVRALDSRGAGIARFALRPHLESMDVNVARRTALQLGSLADPAAASMLVGMLTTAPRDEEILGALAVAVCADFRQMEDPAGMYTEWWRERGQEDPTFWLAHSLENLGRPAPEAFTKGTAATTLAERAEVVRALLDLLLQAPPFLRPAMTYHLNRLTGVDAPAVRARSPEALARKASEAWYEWVDARSED